jgi:hypothetical protein
VIGQVVANRPLWGAVGGRTPQCGVMKCAVMTPCGARLPTSIARERVLALRRAA